jgi:hypothetical protein
MFQSKIQALRRLHAAAGSPTWYSHSTQNTSPISISDSEDVVMGEASDSNLPAAVVSSNSKGDDKDKSDSMNPAKRVPSAPAPQATLGTPGHDGIPVVAEAELAEFVKRAPSVRKVLLQRDDGTLLPVALTPK